MTFNNSKTIISLRIRLFTATVILLGYIILTYIASAINFPVLGMTDTMLTTILVCIYLVFAFYPMALNYQYISYSDEGDKIIFRYFVAGIVSGKKSSVEINKGDFAGYRVDKKLFGLIRSVTLFRQMPQGVAKYPPVYISILSKKERGRILNSLYQHTPLDAPDAEK